MCSSEQRLAVGLIPCLRPLAPASVTQFGFVRPTRTSAMKTRLFCSLVGVVLGSFTGFIFQLFSPSPLPFPLFFPVVFAAVFAAVAFVAVEQLFPVLLEVVLSFLVLGGGAFLWRHFAL